MAIRPDWTSGTLTLVAGSKDFTTTGSALETAALQAGDAIITMSGYVLIIEAITGQNSGTLYAECPVAAAGSNQPLRIRYQPDGSRVQGAMRMVRELLTSGNLEAFAALAGEEDAVPVFVGPGVIKLLPKSEFGPDDTKGNLAAFAQLDSIVNLTELASLAKENNQFIVMGADGKISIMPIDSLLAAIDEISTAVDDRLLKTDTAVNSDKLGGKTEAQLPFFGLGQRWINELSNRAHSTVYQNVTNKTIAVYIRGRVPVGGNTAEFQVSSDNMTTWVAVGAAATNITESSSFLVPPGAFYRVSSDMALFIWGEMR